MNKIDQILAIIQSFREGEARHIVVQQLLPEKVIEQLTRQVDLTTLPIVRDDGYQAYQWAEVYLLWDEELMSLELFKDKAGLGKRLRADRPGDHLPVFDAFPVYIDKSTFDFEEEMSGDTDGMCMVLAHNLRLSPEQLDYTAASLELLDERILADVMSDAFVERNLIPLSVYLGATYIRTHGGGWDVGTEPGVDKTLPFVRTLKERRISILRLVYHGLTGKHGEVLGTRAMFRVMESSILSERYHSS